MRALKQLSIPTWVYFACGVSGVWSMTCYHCVWMREGQDYLPSTVNQSDVCLPENFKPLVVHTEECQSNCLTMILYEYVDSDTLPQQILSRNQSKGKLRTITSSKTSLTGIPNSLNTPKQTIMMTVFYRGCSKDNRFWPDSVCKEMPVPEKNSMYRYEKKCYCPSRLCNGELSSKSERTRLSWNLTALILLLLAFTFTPAGEQQLD